MKPTLSLSRNSARLRLTTKSVNGGYYKGNRTGSMGAHTNFGSYIIDWRKVRTYNCPDLNGFELTPFVTKQVELARPITVSEPSPPSLKRPIDFISQAAYQDYIKYETRTKIDGLEMIRSFSRDAPMKYDYLLKQAEQAESKAQNFSEKQDMLDQGRSIEANSNINRQQLQSEEPKP